MRLFVTGASGFIGARFCRLAVEANHQVAGLVRPNSVEKLPAGVRPVIGTLPYDVPVQAVHNAEVVIHLAAITTADRSRESVAVNEIGTEYLLHLALAADQRPGFVFLSTQSAHGGNSSAYAVTKRASENMVRGSDLAWVIVRPGLVYGSGETGLFARMRQALRKLPVLPMLGGGKALVQPIHVDDLCQALLTIINNISDLRGESFLLGDPVGLTLKDFMARVAAAEGATIHPLTVPLGPVKAGVSLAEKLRIPSPISSDNLRGLQTVQRMDTASSLERLGLKLRDLEVGLRHSAQPVSKSRDARIPVALVGAGKIGIVHGLQLRHSGRARLACIIEPSEKARSLYQGMGFDAAFYPDIESALAGDVAPRAAIIATPADTHLAVAAKCLQAGMHILVEKPLSVTDEDEAKWRELQQSHSRQLIHSGYMAAQFPHLFRAYQIARAQKLGALKAVRLVALQTHITAAEPVRWEMLKARAGGGAMINFGCHVASMLFRLIGWPDGPASGWQWSIYSEEVEDALVAKFNVRSIECTLAVSWSVPGFARPMNCVDLEFEDGLLRVENAAVSVVQGGHVTVFYTQLDFPLNFNMAPDYTGGGFALEHDAFFSAVATVDAGLAAQDASTKFMPAVELPEALRLEHWVRSLYRDLKTAKPSRSEMLGLGIDADTTDLMHTAGEQPE